MKDATFIIVGSGQTGATAAAELRSHGFKGRILLFGEESHAPYERPPLSKDELLQPHERGCFIHAQNFYSKHGIDIRLDTPVSAVDPIAKTVSLADGSNMLFDKLLLATGSGVRRLPLLDRLGSGVHTLRTLDDARELKDVLQPGRSIAVVGGGPVGLEVASSATELGARVTLIERAQHVMGRCSPPVLSRYLCEVHRKRGVHLELGATVLDARRELGRIVLILDNGMRCEVDAVIYGVGVDPETRLAEAAGLQVCDGILVDARCATSHADVYAAGDAARQFDPLKSEYRRRETWDNARIQATVAARAMLGLEPASSAVSWFWTDQCGLNVQLAGDMAAADWIVRGDINAPSFMLLGLDDGALAGAIGVNQGKEMRAARALVGQHARLPTAVWQQSQQPLRSLLGVS
jgi:3-phenylpropionate/trans-cinnamate dioxygenase ferredoxin reductase subunit